MATIQFKKGDAYMAKLEKLAKESQKSVCGPAIYNAADLVANEIRQQLKSVPSDETWGTTGNPANGPSKIQKRGLYNSLGIAKMRDEDGFLNVKIGFDGYNELNTKRWPRGQPNQMVARSVERGTTYMEGHAFVKKAMSKARKPALAEMQKTADEEIEKIMKGK